MTHVLIATSTFYPDISKELVEGASAVLKKAKMTFDVLDVPGALEVPAVIRYGVSVNNYDGFIALGCVIRGETSHYETVCHESARALNLLMLQFNAAIGNGILTVENMKQAKARASVKDGNKGARAAEACLRLMELKDQFGIGRRP